MLTIQIQIPSPEDMKVLDIKFRQYWRLTDVLAKVFREFFRNQGYTEAMVKALHELFLTHGNQDVVLVNTRATDNPNVIMLEGNPTDSFALHAAGQVLGEAGWCVVVTENVDQKRLYVGYDRREVNKVAGLPPPVEPPQEDTTDGRQADVTGEVSQDSLPGGDSSGDLQGDVGLDGGDQQTKQQSQEGVQEQDDTGKISEPST